MSHIKDLNQYQDTIILLSAGEPRKKSTPCSSININNETLLNHQIKSIKKFNKKANIIVVTGYKSDLVQQDIALKIVNEKYATTNTIESLRLALEYCHNSNVFVVHGDLLFNRFSLLFPDKDNIYISISQYIKPTKIGLIHKDGHLLNMSYGLRDKWSQILYLPMNKIYKVQNIINKTNKNKTISDLINILNIDEKILIHQHKNAATMEIE